ncbi:MAG: acyl-CoA transferase, partial [Granulosicoccus sp.]|nr:acyl-CoA transferase [Granulosicoccus sp.]
AGLDLRRPDDRACFETLLASAHVLVHGYRRNALAGLGFDEAARLRANPDLIDVALTAYGWSGPWSKRRGFDSLVQMSTGIADSGMRINASDKPVPLPFQALDHATGYLMAAAIVRAILQRATTGYVLSARLSLARQAKLLQDRPAQSAVEELAMVEERHFAPGIEETPFGPLRRLRLPYTIEGVDLQFAHPVCRLRSAPSRWS